MSFIERDVFKSGLVAKVCCRRCAGQLWQNGEGEVSCLQCGHVHREALAPLPTVVPDDIATIHWGYKTAGGPERGAIRVERTSSFNIV